MMTLEECYERIGGDYGDVIGRLRSERLVHKFVLKFLDDTSFDLLRTSMEQKNAEEAFRAAHTIKGMCLNLGFARLLASAVPLTEALRAKDLEQAAGLMETVTEDYERTVRCIREYGSEHTADHAV